MLLLIPFLAWLILMAVMMVALALAHRGDTNP